MIRVICNQETFVYNAYHMVKAFYPSETVTSSVDEKASNYVTVEFAEDGTDGQKEAMIEIADRQTNDMPAEKSAMKKYLDRMLYKKLSEQSGRTLAWGILMGVRPTKIAMRKLEYSGLCRGRGSSDYDGSRAEFVFVLHEWLFL